MSKYIRLSRNGTHYRIFRRWSRTKPGYEWIVEVFECCEDDSDQGHWWTHSESTTKTEALKTIEENKDA